MVTKKTAIWFVTFDTQVVTFDTEVVTFDTGYRKSLPPIEYKIELRPY